MYYDISILSLYAEGNIDIETYSDVDIKFQSSPSMQRETLHNYIQSELQAISILSLYAEGDERSSSQGGQA